ncbi:hypothetical protein BZA05DRAFT_465729 [Tricharina praecox]|uniref:uncharacterized protein n=1 Tax=Tricharina praecox TaxID=43433 RepID=UPI002220E633|nr:uncharacterized protein BZA05DRAFT_465729 [Tricharina praecox]KAI5840932.1 hypothetical protein BZA05DRAFT_465729 [Tricharina praecox]
MATNPAMAPPPTTTKPAKDDDAGTPATTSGGSRSLVACGTTCGTPRNLTGELVPFVMRKRPSPLCPTLGAQVWMTFKDVDQACYIVYYEQGRRRWLKKFFKIMPDEDMTGMVNTPRQARRIERQARIQVQARAARRQALQAELQARAVRRHARQVAIQGVAQRQAQVQARQLKTQAQVKVQPWPRLKFRPRFQFQFRLGFMFCSKPRAARREAKVQARAARVRPGRT